MTKKLPKPKAERAKPRRGIVMDISEPGHLRDSGLDVVPPDPMEDADIRRRGEGALAKLRFIPQLTKSLMAHQEHITQLATSLEVHGFHQLAGQIQAEVLQSRILIDSIGSISEASVALLDPLVDTGAKNRQGNKQRLQARLDRTNAEHKRWQLEAERIWSAHPSWSHNKAAMQVKAKLKLLHSYHTIRKYISQP